eukprot:CFRG0354T1
MTTDETDNSLEHQNKDDGSLVPGSEEGGYNQESHEQTSELGNAFSRDEGDEIPSTEFDDLNAEAQSGSFEGEGEGEFYAVDGEVAMDDVFDENGMRVQRESIIGEGEEMYYTGNDYDNLGEVEGDDGFDQQMQDIEGGTIGMPFADENMGEEYVDPETLMQHNPIRSEYAALLSTTDAIMEPDVSENLRQFMRAGGLPKEAIEFLSGNYRGLAQMANLMAQWLMITGVSQEEITKIFEEYVSSLILQYFNSQEADASMANTESEYPPWLDEMILYPQWRQLIADLTERHHDSYLLKYTVQKISDAGYQSEMMNVTTASTHLEVFNRVLMNQFKHILSLDTGVDSSDVTDERETGESINARLAIVATTESEEYRIAIAEFVKTACYTGSTYLYTQTLLHSLMERENSCLREKNTLRRISQEVENFAKDNEHNVLHLSLLLTGCATTYPEVAVSLNGLLAKGEANPADIIRLHKAYTTNAHSGVKRPPIKLVQIPQLIEMLIDTLFDPKKKMLPQHRTTYIAFLALIVNGNTDEDGNSEQNDTHVKATTEAIEKTVGVCQKNYIVWSDPEPVKIILENMKNYPVLAPGILKWIRFNLSDSDYFVSNFSTGQVPIHLAILDRVAQYHPHTCARVFELVRMTFERSDLGLQAIVNMEMKKILIDRMIHIMTCGYVLEVIEHLAAQPPLDHTLQRYAVAEILSTISPPYSLELVDKVLDLVQTTGPVLHSTSEARAVVKEFINGLKQSGVGDIHATSTPISQTLVDRISDMAASLQMTDVVG